MITRERTRSGVCSPRPKHSRPPPGDPDEMRSLDVELVEDRHDVRDAESHLVGLGLVGLVAPTVTSVVDEDEPELVSDLLEGPGDRGGPSSSTGSRNPPRTTTGEPCPPSSSKYTRSPSRRFVANGIDELPQPRP